MNREIFFSNIRVHPFGGRLTQKQVEGLDILLDKAPRGMDIRQLAYCLATTFHETDQTMQPIREHGDKAYFTRMYDIRGNRPKVAKRLGNTNPGDGAKYAGRGFVQITGRRNYTLAGEILDLNLIDSPDMAMQPNIAAPILYEGMSAGWFTGNQLSDYFSATRDDPVEARRIVNGMDRAARIAGYHREFLTALEAASYGVKAIPIVPKTYPPITSKPVDKPVAKKESFWSLIIEIILGFFKGK